MIAILSDLHGNLPALEAVLEDMPSVSKIWVCGDIVGELPYPCEVLDRLLDLKTVSIAGNREFSLLEYYQGEHEDWRSGSQFGVLSWTADRLKPYHWEYFKSLEHPLIIDNINGGAILAHGAPDKVRGKILTYGQAVGALKKVKEHLLVVGHSHCRRLFTVGNQMVIGAGSLGISLDGVGSIAVYALYDEINDKVYFRNIPYDVESVIDDIHKSGLYDISKGICDAISLELRNGRHYVMSLIEFAYTYAERMLGEKISSIPDELWREAEGIWDMTEWRMGRKSTS